MDHTVKIIKESWEADGLLETAVEELAISISTDDTDTSEEDESESEESDDGW